MTIIHTWFAEQAPYEGPKFIHGPEQGRGGSAFGLTLDEILTHLQSKRHDREDMFEVQNLLDRTP